ncbi:hypothetical protein QBC39DRAFT_354014 [Podospora conica]|nr:hypothetical protein QBC39DRAFT_354014 [Schizothecium conicum]
MLISASLSLPIHVWSPASNATTTTVSCPQDAYLITRNTPSTLNPRSSINAFICREEQSSGTHNNTATAKPRYRPQLPPSTTQRHTHLTPTATIKMCSFTQESLHCANCGQLLSTSSIFFRTCDPKPKLHCNSYKKRASYRRYVSADECPGCARDMFEEEMELLAIAEEEERLARIEAGECASASESEESEAGDEDAVEVGWRVVTLEDFIKPAKRGRRGRA